MPDDDEAEAVFFGEGFDDGLLPDGGMEGGGGGAGGAELVPSGDQGGVLRPVVVADGAKGAGFDGVRAGVEPFAEQVFDGAF